MTRIIPARAGFTTAPGCPSRSAWDHPRSRGVYTSRSLMPAARAGSSPLARGLQGGRSALINNAGIIPARAGFTPALASRQEAATDHPRSRGVYHAGAGGPGHDVGIIPARAGFTTGAAGSTGAAGDHPRSRGVYPPDHPAPGRCGGSSPLARGLRLRHDRGEGRPGIIPARAGFTGRRTTASPLRMDHPRSRGVYYSSRSPPSGAPGSSPLARGLLSKAASVSWRARIIPARAGFTPYLTLNPPQSSGSSPLARGLLAQVLHLRRRVRIIPARAGFTCRGGSRGSTPSDHPRSRGVYPPPTCAPCTGRGSSPLARGLPARRGGDHDLCGIIPARAGFTGRSC